jgi:hypothetical protein
MRRSVSEKMKVIQDLRDVMAMMQNDPELEETDTLSVMEDIISDTLYYFTGERYRTRDKQKALTTEVYSNVEGQ